MPTTGQPFFDSFELKDLGKMFPLDGYHIDDPAEAQYVKLLDFYKDTRWSNPMDTEVIEECSQTPPRSLLEPLILYPERLLVSSVEELRDTRTRLQEQLRTVGLILEVAEQLERERPKKMCSSWIPACPEPIYTIEPLRCFGVDQVTYEELFDKWWNGGQKHLYSDPGE